MDEKKRHLEYVAPHNAAFRQLAREVCKHLSQEKHPAYGDAEVIDGLADFLVVVAKLQAKTLTRQVNNESVDSDKLQIGEATEAPNTTRPKKKRSHKSRL